MKKIVIGLSIVMFCNIAFAQPYSYWLEKEKQAQKEAYQKVLLKEDICDVCKTMGKSAEMYRVLSYGKPYYEGEFVRVHKQCLIPNYFVQSVPDNEIGISWSKMFENKVRIERIEIARLFPFLDILDDLIDWTSSIVFYKVKNKNNQKTYELYKWEGTWQTRERQKDGKFKFLGEPK